MRYRLFWTFVIAAINFLSLYPMDSCVLVLLLVVANVLYFEYSVSADIDLNLTRNSLLTGVSVISFFAFLSAYYQLAGLIGANGITSLSKTLSSLKSYLESKNAKKQSWLDSDTLMVNMLQLVYEKFNTTEDPAKQVSVLTLIDIIISVISFAYPHPVLFAYLYVSYYSIKRVGGRFFNFQWDALLLETLFLSVLLSMAYDAQTIAMCICTMKALLFRLMFGSGLVKFFSRDESWNKSYSAMSYHFLTQPLPTQGGMYAYNLTPKWMFRYMTLGTLVVELGVSLVSVLNIPRLNRLICVSYLLLQASIAFTGYYGFFNPLTMVLSLSLLDDAALVGLMRCGCGKALTARILEVISVHSYYSTGYLKVRVLSAFGLVFRAGCSCVLYPAVLLLFASHVMSLYLLAERVGGVDCPFSAEYPEDSHSAVADTRSDSQTWTKSVHRAIRHFCRSVLLPVHDTLLSTLFVGNHYGLFANMTKSRNEVSIEVSVDKEHWQSVEFLAKPGDPDSPPKRITPFFHLPRLDWVMWFLSFKPTQKDLPDWFWILLVAIMTGDSPDILRLLHPTRNEGVVTGRTARFEFVRVSLVNYQFSGRVKGNVDSTLGAAASSTSEPPPQRTTGRYWSTAPVAIILPPTSLADVYAMLDAQDEALQQHKAQRRPPSAEDAKDIILRTLFSKLHNKKIGKEE